MQTPSLIAIIIFFPASLLTWIFLSMQTASLIAIIIFFGSITLQLWDLGLFSNTFIGASRMDLRKIHKPMQSAKEAPTVFDETKVKTMNLFKVKNAKGWWPCVREEVRTRENWYGGYCCCFFFGFGFGFFCIREEVRTNEGVTVCF